MGIVYRAYDLKLKRDVAIKLLQGTLDAQARQQVLREAQAASALNHPGICTVFEVEDDGAQAFIVMEFIEGRQLDQIIPPGGLTPGVVLDYGVQMADALAHAHGRGVVHRDVKPPNVLVTRQGRLKILDFGLANRSPLTTFGMSTRSGASLGQADPLAGTLAYMAPEQLQGEAATTRSDVWSLGVVLYEMATGRRPFSGSTPFALSSVMLHGAPDALPGTVSAGLKRVVQRCLSADPSRRYQQAGEVHAALEAVPVPERTLRHGTARRPAPRARIKALAVLPLENLSGDSNDEHFADGMTDALITTLAQIRALRIISRTSTMRYKGARRPLPEIAQELHVDAVVEGTVVRAGGRVRINAQLIHAATDAHLWARQYETDLRDVLALQSEVARAIADEIQVQLSPQERARLAGSRPVDPVAYEAFLVGRHLWYRRSPDALGKAVEYLQQAVTMDPSYALAHAALADAYVSLGWDLFGLSPPSESYPRAKQAAQRALALDPDCAEAHAALGWSAAGYDWDWATAEQEMRRAIELKPQYGPVHIWYSHFLRAMGRCEESLAESRRAIACDPLGLVLNMHMGWHHLYSQQYDAAVAQCQKTLELDPTFIQARIFLGEAYLFLGRFGEAIAQMEEAVRLSGRAPSYLADLGHAYALAGRQADAVATVAELQTLSADRFVSPRGIADIYFGLGRLDEAFEWLDQAFVQRSGWLVHVRENPRYARVRSDPRYLDLVHRLNFP